MPYAAVALDWHCDLLGVGVLAAAAITFARGARRVPASGVAYRQRRCHALAFWSGWLVLAIAFGPPLHALTESSFTAHMAQHELLMLVAAPLFILARPQGVLMWGLPDVIRRSIAAIVRSRSTRRVFTVLATPVGAWLLHLVVLWGWHVPGAFDAAVTNGAVHWAQHVSFFIAAAIFWHSIVAPGRAAQHSAPAVISLFTTAAHTSLLGVLLTFSTAPWYRVYAAGTGTLTSLEDQQIGGLIMWIPGGLVFVAAALAIVGVWLVAPRAAS